MGLKIATLVIGLIVIGFLGSLARNALIRRFAGARGPVTLEDFISALPQGIDRTIAENVHALFVAVANVSEFPVMPSDDIELDLGLEWEDFDEKLLWLSDECGVHLPDGCAADVKTVEDVVLLLDRYKRGAELGAGRGIAPR